MRRIAFALAAIVALAGCARPSVTSGGDDQTAEMMAAAIEQLVTVDHTFGSGPPPFTHYLIQSGTDPSAGMPEGGGSAERPLTSSEQDAIESVLEPFGEVRWIDDPADYRTEDLVPTIEGAVILGVGEPVIEGSTGLVPVSLWCGGLCGTWLTYRLDQVNGVWEVTEIEGPIAIS